MTERLTTEPPVHIVRVEQRTITEAVLKIMPINPFVGIRVLMARFLKSSIQNLIKKPSTFA